MKKIYALLFCALFSLRPALAQFSNALHFDGTNDYVSSGVPSVFNSIATQDLTIEAWIRPDNFTFSRILFAQVSGNTFASLSLSGGGAVYFYTGTGSNYYSAQGGTIALNQWTHIAATWKASTTAIEIYINGSLVASSFGGSTSTGTSGQMSIGARPGGAQHFNGAIDELRIWNAVRTSAQINANKNAELTLPQTGLVSYYKFNQGIAGGNNPTVVTLNDALNITNGSLNNFALSGNTSNWIDGTIALPLEWLEVKGVLNKAHKAELSWKVQEKQVANYIVERSADASQFSAISSVTSKGDGVNEYSFIDINLLEGANYYRLKQVDEDGRFTYSAIVTVNLSNNNSGVTIYPDPATTMLHVIPGEQKGNFQIYDGTGKLLRSAASTGEMFRIDVSALLPGVYFYRIGNKKGSFIKKP